jgi:carbon starvation protein
MNALLLVVLAALAFGFGYRFYAKLLAVGIFRLSADYSPSASLPPPRARAADRLVILGHHAAACSALAPAAVLAALAWGWVPVFLWIVIGTTIAGGLYALGGLWLRIRGARDGSLATSGLLEPLGGERAQAAAAVSIGVLLAALAAVASALAAALLAAHPGAVLPYILLLALAWGFGAALNDGSTLILGIFSALALALELVGTALLGKLTIAFTGAFNLELRGEALLTLTAVPAWTVLLFAWLYASLRAPIGRLARPAGYLGILLTGCVLLVLFAGTPLAAPDWPLPAFHRPDGGPPAAPFLFVTLGSGAVAGVYLLLGHSVTAPELERERDARFVGYGAALLLGTLALGVLLAAASAIAAAGETDVWRVTYGAAAQMPDLPGLLALYLDGVARAAGALGISPSYARLVAVVAAAGLFTVTAEAALRALKRLIAAALARRQPGGRVPGDRSLTGLTLAAPGVSALYIAAHPFGAEGLRLIGTLDLMVAAGGGLVLAAALTRAARPAALAMAVFALATALLAWALAAQMIEWGVRGHWFRVVLWLLLSCAVIGLAVAGWRTLARIRPQPPPG